MTSYGGGPFDDHGPEPVQPVPEEPPRQPIPGQFDRPPAQAVPGQPPPAGFEPSDWPADPAAPPAAAGTPGAGLTAEIGRSGVEDLPATGAASATSAGGRRKPKRRLQAALIALLAVIGLGGFGAGAFMVIHELTRAPTRAELAVASKAEVAQRWRELSAGKIFPARVRYPSADRIVSGTAHLVGIAPQSTCAAAARSSVAEILRTQGCKMVLRATYSDASGFLLTTIGVAVMRDVASAQAVVGDLAGTGKGIHPVGFIGSPSRWFKDAAVVYANVTGRGPYVIMDVSGFADGRRASAVPLGFRGQFGFSDVIAMSVLDRLTKRVPACAAEDVRC